MAKILYKGFSTVNRNKKFRVTDVELCKQDLLNHFSVRKGEKLMQPNFGSVIWNLLFEPLTEQLQQLIIDDVRRIVGYDPRLGLKNININSQDYGIQIEVDLVYMPTNQATNLSLQFDSNSMTLTTGGPY
jgi:phage baseplate assembly protein W